MAKAKKKESTLTLEEKLAQALVPESEQPYKVPKNWCWVRLDSLYSLNPKNVADSKIDAAFIPMEKVSAGMVSDFSYEVQTWEKAKKGHTQFADGDVAFAKISPCFENRKSMVLNGLPNGIGGGTTELIVLRQPLVDNRYTFWLITDERFINGGINTYSGTVGQQRISTDYVKSYQVPLAPLVEQKRIVERIEDLFAKLDEAKEKLQAVLDSFETRKAAILHKAFTGELTAKWREENCISLDSWEKKKLGECGVLERGKSKHRPRNDERLFGGVYPFIQTGDIASSDVYVVEHKQTLSEFGLQQSKLFPAGTLCITIAANIGDVAILSYDCCFPDSVVGFTPNVNVDSKFIYYMMRVLQKEIEDNAPATAQKNINLKILNEIIIQVPDILEQRVIVEIIEECLNKENKIKESVEVALQNVNAIKKAILARAFRGELGTNNENDECAVELLKRVL